MKINYSPDVKTYLDRFSLNDYKYLVGTFETRYRNKTKITLADISKLAYELGLDLGTHSE